MSVPLGRNYWKLWVASVVSNFGDGVATIAYPWLASAVTRNPIHISAVLVVTRLPWLLFSLPAGVITDRVDRRKLVAWMDVGRFVVTLGVALAVLAAQPQLSSPEKVAAGGAVPDSAGLLLLLIYAAAMLLGTAEVFRDNSAQTLMPAIVDGENLEEGKWPPLGCRDGDELFRRAAPWRTAPGGRFRPSLLRGRGLFRRGRSSGVHDRGQFQAFAGVC